LAKVAKMTAQLIKLGLMTSALALAAAGCAGRPGLEKGANLEA